MARLPRLTIPGHPHHVVQRGNNRQAIFSSDSDHELLLALIDEHAGKFGVAVHAYVLMANHFHLLATPLEPDSLSGMMQAVGRRYVRHFNAAQARTGTLWEGRYRSTLIQADRYLLACMAYIDLNPVRAGIVGQPLDYRWSSHAHYVGGRHDKLLKPHSRFWALGNTPFAREATYADLVRGGVDDEQLNALTQSVMHGWALGDSGFLAEMQKLTGRRLTQAKPGRPPLPKG